jgi:hypothetical protein
VVVDKLDVGSIGNKASVLAELGILLAVELGESPLLGDDDLLPSRELEGSAAGGLHDVLGHVVLAADREDDLTNLHTSHDTVGLSEGTTHSSLETISSGAGKHFVDTDHVPWVHSHTHVEAFLGSHLNDVLVAANASCFESLAGQLFSLQRDKVEAEGEFISGSLLSAKVKDADLSIWHTTAITGLGVRPVLAVPVTSRRASSHGDSD